MDILWTPLPVVIASVIWSALWWSKIANKKWTKIGRILCIVVISFNLGYWYNGWNAKLAAGAQAAEAYLITKFTGRIGKLIEDNRIDKAQELLATFNKGYPAVARNHKETNKLLETLMKETQ